MVSFRQKLEHLIRSSLLSLGLTAAVAGCGGREKVKHGSFDVGPNTAIECTSNWNCRADTVCQDNRCVSLDDQKIIQQRTNAQGNAFFTDLEDSEPVTIIVTDAQNNPLRGIDVSFLDRRLYKLFVAYDSTAHYLPALNLYDHNSTHTIKMCRRDAGLCVSQVLDTDVTSAYSRWRAEFFGNQERYIKTIDLTEKVAREESRRENRDELFFYGTEKFIIILSGRYDQLAGAVLDTFSVKEMWEVLKRTSGFVEPLDSSIHPRWDIYQYEKWEQFGRFFQVPVTAGTALVPSNIPRIEELEAVRTGSQVDVRWVVTDDYLYLDNPLIFEDKTIFLPPSPFDPDLYTSHQLFNSSRNRLEAESPAELQGISGQHYSHRFSLPETGLYELVLTVRDEVHNTSTHRVQIDFNSNCRDYDQDGWSDASCGGRDCDDYNPQTSPGVSELCFDGADNNCDGSIDERCVGRPPLPSCQDDDDYDGHISARCAGGTDCDDTDPNNYRGAHEFCDNEDNNCDGQIDEVAGCEPPSPPPLCHDNDGDGFLDSSCGGADCDDASRDVNPRAPEVTDGRDNNCDGGIDENIVGVGDPQVTLFWNGSSDLDLHVYTPDGSCHLSYQNRDCGAGHLDRDARAACVQRDEPPENIFFDRGAAPNGQYTVAVRYFQDCGDGPARFRLAMSVNGRVVRSIDDTLQRECQGDVDRAPECQKEYTFQK